LNCNASLHGLYCHVCGQENVEPKQSAWHLVSHFFYDITHFDGKFFTTVKDLLVKPGFLSREFISGKRISYLHPIRMYVFTSAIFFIIFFSLYDVKHLTESNNFVVNGKGIDGAKKQALANAKSKEDSIEIERAFSGFKNSPSQGSTESSVKSRNRSVVNFGKSNEQYTSVREYDSVQHALPDSLRDGWFRKIFQRKAVALNEKYKENTKEFFADWGEAFFHNFPKLLFISLPLFALLLKLLYVRRKQFYYADHGIFAIHLYIYSFIALLFIFLIKYVKDVSSWSWVTWISVAISLYSLYYFYKAMRFFYQQGGFKTFAKYVILFILSFFMLMTLFMFFFVFSILQI